MNRSYLAKTNKAALFFAMALLPSGLAYSQTKKDTAAKEKKIEEHELQGIQVSELQRQKYQGWVEIAKYQGDIIVHQIIKKKRKRKKMKKRKRYYSMI